MNSRSSSITDPQASLPEVAQGNIGWSPDQFGGKHEVETADVEINPLPTKGLCADPRFSTYRRGLTSPCSTSGALTRSNFGRPGCGIAAATLFYPRGAGSGWAIKCHKSSGFWGKLFRYDNAAGIYDEGTNTQSSEHPLTQTWAATNVLLDWP